ENDKLVFRGSPDGWPKATTTTFVFRHLVAEEVRLDYIDLPSVKDARRLHAGLKQRLSKWFGAPWLERLPAQDEKATASKTTWENEALYAELASEHSPLDSVSVFIRRSAHLEAKREVEAVKGDADSYDLAYVGLSTLAKEAAETLFDDFGELPLVLESARDKGEPLTVKLSDVEVPEEVEGVDRELIERRFMQLTAGNWNLELTSGKRATDVELRVALVPTRVNGKKTFSMRLDAYVDERGGNRRKISQRKIYSASHRLR
ncbi:MAG: hypothetical protein AAF658_21115, partial [Myxococcota bacterium]